MKSLFIFLFTILVFIILVRYLENTGIFYPSPTITSTPENVGLPYEDVYFVTEDNIKINGWYIKHHDAKSTLVFFHGNAGNIGDRLDKIMLFHQMGLNVFIIDYRGYGKSEGRPSEQGLYMDAIAAFDYLVAREDVDSDKIISYGASLGGIAAVDLAAKKKVACLIADSSFTKASDMSKKIYPFIPTLFLKSKMDQASKVKTITYPKLFIHSTQDEIVPFELGKKLYEAAIEPKKFLELKGTHNTLHIDSEAEFRDGIKNFLINLGLI